MFIDKAKIYIKAGDGGDGAVSFRREKYVPAGGPDGGDGGNGGSVVFKVDDGMRTLLDFKYERKFSAGNGEKGNKKNMRGADGKNLIINVPPGTVIKDYETGRVVADMRQGERLLLHGGSGGKGNSRFVSSTRQIPRFSTPGEKAKGRQVVLELKSIADIGLIGFPNVGKSTLLAASTSAKPKIADYHFTTLKPNLGVASVGDYSFVMADIPGLIEGASEGAGLGHEFLRHIERTRMLIHVVDASCIEGRDLIEDYEAIRKELAGYSQELLVRPEIVAANKMDQEGAYENAKELKNYLEPKGIEFFEICAAIGEGTDELLKRATEMLKELPVPEPVDDDGVIEEWELEREDKKFEIFFEDGAFFVEGAVVKEIMAKTNPDDPDSMRHFQKLLKDYGIIKALRKKGAKTGDIVCLEGLEFDYVE